MIRGVVNARHEAIVQLRVRGPAGTDMETDAVIDTGFSASLTMPAATIAALRLVRQSGTRAVLADGSVRQFDLFAAEVSWNGVWWPVLVSAMGDEVLIGTRLLAEHELRIAVVPGGAVVITPLP